LFVVCTNWEIWEKWGHGNEGIESKFLCFKYVFILGYQILEMNFG
jgi:hypothetical protein